jgi:hypothetical protein
LGPPQADLHQVQGRRWKWRHQIIAREEHSIAPINVTFSGLPHAIAPGGQLMQGHWTFFRPVRLQALRKRSVRLVLE